jgi:hypothetical protein
MLAVFSFTRQNLYQSGLLDHIVRYPVSGVRNGGPSTGVWVYDADSVLDWARRLARRHILVEWGLLSKTSPLPNAPADGKPRTILACLPQSKQALLSASASHATNLDAQCPKCGQFALRHPEQTNRIRCQAGHDTDALRATATVRRRPPRKTSR